MTNHCFKTRGTMEMHIIDEAKHRMIFELVGESHTFCHFLKDELNQDNHVKISSYSIKHPLLGKPRFIIETDASSNPKKALKEAVKRLKKRNEKLKKYLKKEIK